MEGFNPSSSEYKKVEDLPIEHQENFVDVEGGFVRKEVIDAKKVSEQEGNSSLDELARSYDERRDDIINYFVKQNKYNIGNKKEEIFSNKDAMFELIKEWGRFFEFASDSLHSDRDFVLKLIKETNGDILSSASDELRNDKDVVAEAVKTYAGLRGASDKLRSDRDFVIEMSKLNPRVIGTASDSLREELSKDRIFILEFLKWCDYGLSYASEELRADRDFVLEAIKINGRSFSCASDKLHADRELALEAVKRNGEQLMCVSKELHDDKEIVLEALKQNNNDYISETFEGDPLDHHRIDLAEQDISERLLADKDFILEAVQIYSPILKHISWELRNDKNFMIEAKRLAEMDEYVSRIHDMR